MAILVSLVVERRRNNLLVREETRKEVLVMVVEKIGEKYRCGICGNEVVVTAVGGGTLVCCGEDMEKTE